MKPYILNIHTATESAIVNLSHGKETLYSSFNNITKEHAAFLHPAIEEVLQKGGIEVKHLHSVAVSAGPGSYTGIRVGLAAAKGLCYALKIPAITYNTLELMALSAMDTIKEKNILYCPMIDARRMEVYTAVYDSNMKIIEAPIAMILDESSFAMRLSSGKILFFGSGSKKFHGVVTSSSARFTDINIDSKILTHLAAEKYERSDFQNILSMEPLYMKEFYTTSKK
ncbi:MAG: tRNA (adenosine(37)-N6)-threonylcarbamoyltransferase complex dimerization subunit type 1 TsaB [Ginsengibacter sp.]